MSLLCQRCNSMLRTCAKCYWEGSEVPLWCFAAVNAVVAYLLAVANVVGKLVRVGSGTYFIQATVPFHPVPVFVLSAVEH